MSKQTRRALLPVLVRDRLMVTMMAIYVGYFALFLQTFTTLPLVMTADGHSPATYGAVLALNGMVIVVVQPLAVRLLAGRDRGTVLAVSMLLVGVGAGSAPSSTAALARSDRSWSGPLVRSASPSCSAPPSLISRRPTCGAGTWAPPPARGASAPCSARWSAACCSTTQVEPRWEQRVSLLGLLFCRPPGSRSGAPLSDP